MNITQALAQSQQLQNISDSARLDIELLLAHALQKSRTYLLTWPERELSAEQAEKFKKLFEQRLAGQPIAYLLGFQDFWTLSLEVSPDTLIPRADTERLVEVVLDLELPKAAKIVDLGTGTGAIALALSSERPSWQVIGVDYVAGAVDLARRNAERLQLNQVSFVQSHWLDDVQGSFDLIVSNPPYIDACDPHLQQGDVRFEPRTALVAENQGLADIVKITDQAREYLNKGGYLAFEHGYQQAESVAAILDRSGYTQIQTYQDYAGNDRVTLGCWADTEGVDQ